MNSIEALKNKLKTVKSATAVLTVILLLCFRFSFEADNGYFIGGVLPILFWIAYAVSALIAVSAILIPSEFEILTTPDEISDTFKRFYIFASLGAAFIGAIGIVLSKNQLAPINACIGLGFLGIYFISIAIKGYEFKLGKAICLFVSVLMPSNIALANNSDFVHHINSIENLLTVFFACSFLAYVLQEAIKLCKGIHTKWHFVTMSLTFISGISLSVSYILAFLVGTFEKSSRIYQMLMILSASILVGIELHRFIITLKSEPASKAAPSSMDK